MELDEAISRCYISLKINKKYINLIALHYFPGFLTTTISTIIKWNLIWDLKSVRKHGFKVYKYKFFSKRL